LAQRIGVLGGTFNPVHMGHLVLAQDALEGRRLDRMLFVPSASPPHKEHANVLGAAHRLAMLEAALHGDARFDISTVELDRGGVSYSVETMRELKAQRPDAEFFFVIGADSLYDLHEWRKPYALLEMCEFIVMGRPGYTETAITPETVRLNAPWPSRLRRNLVAGHLVDISSSDIRRRVAGGRRIRYLVPEAVESYISEHHLYR